MDDIGEPPVEGDGASGVDVAGSRPAMVRAGRLAGRAVLLAWGLSVLYHVLLFVAMYALPWMAGLASELGDAPPPVAELVGPVDGSVRR